MPSDYERTDRLPLRHNPHNMPRALQNTPLRYPCVSPHRARAAAMALSQLEAENARLTRSAAQQFVAATAPQLGNPVDHLSNSLSGPHLGRVSSTSEERVTQAALSACRLGRAVIGTVASPSYAQPLLALAASARNVGFRCVTVSPYSHFDALKDPRIRRLGDPRRPLLPEPEWCSNVTAASTMLPSLGNKKAGIHPASQYYGWRRSHLYRTWMWYVVVSHNYDLLAVDLDWRFISNPLPSLYSAKQPGGSAAAVVASNDEVSTALLLAKKIRSPPSLYTLQLALPERRAYVCEERWPNNGASRASDATHLARVGAGCLQ